MKLIKYGEEYYNANQIVKFVEIDKEMIKIYFDQTISILVNRKDMKKILQLTSTIGSGEITVEKIEANSTPLGF